MFIGVWLIMILYAVIGGVSTLSLVIGIPAILGWKVYRKAKLNISVFN